MANKRDSSEIININVGGKRFTVRRGDLTMDPNSKLNDWFKPNSTKGPAQDKSGNYFLDRDGKSFRYVLSYLRMKKDKFPLNLTLPMRPDELSRLAGEAAALHLEELQDLCMEMLHRYQREEAGYEVAYINSALRDFDSWQFEHTGTGGAKSKRRDWEDW